MSNENSAHSFTEGSDAHRVIGMTQYQPPQHIVPGGPELGYFQSDDLWTEEQVAMWRKNWFSDAKPNNYQFDNDYKNALSFLMKEFNASEYETEDDQAPQEAWKVFANVMVAYANKFQSIQHRILNNGDKLI